MIDSYITAGIVVPPLLRGSTTLRSYLHHAYAFEQAAMRFSAEILSYRNGRASYAQAMKVISRLMHQINSNSDAVVFLGKRIYGRLQYDERHRHHSLRQSTRGHHAIRSMTSRIPAQSKKLSRHVRRRRVSPFIKTS